MRNAALTRNLKKMGSRIARFLLIFAALWLPVQSMAGMAVSVCMNMQSHEAHAGQQVDAMPCHDAAADDQAAQHDGCDNCEICHLASAGFMPSATAEPALIPVGNRFAAAVIVAPPSFIAEPPQHPPRRTG